MYKQDKTKKFKNISIQDFINRCTPEYLNGVNYGYSATFDTLLYPEINKAVKKILKDKKK